MDRIYLDNDMVLELAALKDESGTAVTSATVEATLYERDKSTEIGGETWPITLTHQSDGTYRGDLTRAIEVTEGQVVWAKVTGTYNGKQYEGWQQAYCTRRNA